MVRPTGADRPIILLAAMIFQARDFFGPMGLAGGTPPA
jgi:hypothetical protein